MEYFLDDKGQIYGDFAFRLGKIINQYEQFIEYENKENFITTLCVSSLQSMLTIYIELFDRFNGYPCTRVNDYLNAKTSINKKNYLGIEKDWVTYDNKFNRDISVFVFLKQLRNALSHPNKIININSTGYCSKSISGIISSYIFSAYDDKNNKLFVIEIKSEELINLTKRLATLLAQPVVKKWDGITFNENLLSNYAA
jgi:hypothetical protein